MRYTLNQYHRIMADAGLTAALCRVTGKPNSFRCETTSCAFCPFAHGKQMCWRQEHTADEWDKWISTFSTDNDPDRPYTVEIPADRVYYIEMALRLATVDDDNIVKLLSDIYKQINDQNRN